MRGPLGNLTVAVPSFVNVGRSTTDDALTLSVHDQGVKHQRSMWGTIRAQLSNAVSGVSEGHTVSLRFVGVGYRAAVAQSTSSSGQTEVTLRLGYAKPIVLVVPAGVEARCPIPTSLILSGPSKGAVTQFAAVIRSKRPPEPYKGKGVFVGDETIKIKDKKGKK